jgi:hypothetical protein
MRWHLPPQPMRVLLQPHRQRMQNDNLIKSSHRNDLEIATMATSNCGTA